MQPNQTPIPALRYKNLVYVRNLKCGSTFFYENFVDTFKWAHTSFDHIDWRTDHVFGHMIDPVVRRHKGVAEFIDMCGLLDQYLASEPIQTLLAVTPFLDRHAVSYTDLFQDKCHSIDWIPLLLDNRQNVLNTQKFLNAHGFPVDMCDWNFDHAHQGSWKKKQAEILLKKNWMQAWECKDAWLTKSLTRAEFAYLKADTDLYQAVIENFNPEFENWSQITWLKHSNKP